MSSVCSLTLAFKAGYLIYTSKITKCCSSVKFIWWTMAIGIMNWCLTLRLFSVIILNPIEKKNFDEGTFRLNNKKIISVAQCKQNNSYHNPISKSHHHFWYLSNVNTPISTGNLNDSPKSGSLIYPCAKSAMIHFIPWYGQKFLMTMNLIAKAQYSQQTCDHILVATVFLSL